MRKIVKLTVFLLAVFGGAAFCNTAKAVDHTWPGAANPYTDNITLETGNNFTVTGITGTVSGDIDGDGSLVKLGDGTLVLSGDNTFTGGTVLSAGTIVLGCDTALGTWVAGDPAATQSGMLSVIGGDGTIQVLEDRTITNHFQLGTTADRKGSLRFDIASGKTLTITGVQNTATNDYLGRGGAINVNVYSTDGTSSPLTFSGGNLVFSSNKSATRGGAVGAWFDDLKQHSVFDFRGLESVTFSGNIAGNTYGFGGGINFSSSSVTL